MLRRGLRYRDRNLQRAGLTGHRIEDAGAEGELAAWEVDGQREFQWGSEEAVVLRGGDGDLEGLAARGDELAVEVVGAKVDFDGRGAGAIGRLYEGELFGVEGEDGVVGRSLGVRKRGAGGGCIGRLRGR